MPLVGPIRRRLLTDFGAGALALVVGAAISVGAFVAARTGEERRIQDQLDFRADWRAVDIEHKLSANFQAVMGTSAMVASSAEPTARGFDTYVRTRYGYATERPRFMAWAPRVPYADRDAFEAKARALGLKRYLIEEPSKGPSGRLVPAAARPEYYPLLLGVGLKAAPSLGLDVAYSEVRRTAIRFAIESGGLGVFGVQTPIASVSTPTPGIVVYAPVYAASGIPAVGSARGALVRGLIVARYDLEPLLNAALVNTPQNLGGLMLLRGPVVTGRSASVAATYDPARRRFLAIDTRIDPGRLDGYNPVRSFNLGGQIWPLLFHFPPAETAAMRTSGPWAWLIVGLLLTGVVAAYLMVERRRMGRVEALVAQRTADLTRTQSFLDLVIENIPAMVFVKDAAEKRLVLINRAGEELLGADRGELIGKNAYDMFPEDEAGSFTAADQEVLDSGRLQVIPRESITTRLKGVRLLQTKKIPVLDEEGRPRFLLGLSEDITERVATEEQLIQARKMEAVGQLTGGIAHDFNNLLGVIIGNLDLLQWSLDADDSHKEQIADALSAALKGAELTRSLLAVARRQPLQKTVIDPNTAIDALAGLIGRTLGEEFKIEIHKASGLWPAVADPAQLESAILNLCVNARDAMPGGGVLVIQTSNQYLDENYVERNVDVAIGDYVLVSVTDTGVGMSSEVISRAVDPFFTTKDADKGAGLGLSMVSGFVKQLGGHFKLYSEVGHGTTAKIYLPRSPSIDLTPVSRGDESAPRAVAGETILVVDDKDELRKVVIKQLRELGYQTIEATDGPSALRVLSGEAKIDLLFTDVVMPGGMSGYDLSNAARELRPGLSVLFTSGFPAVAENGSGRLDPSAPLLSKPYQRQDLAQKLRAVLGADRGGAQ
jgi:PAS domain S-box-containing protein